MSPTVFRHKNYRFYFFSREEERKHIHIYSPDGEAKFWIEPNIELSVNKGLKKTELKEIEKLIEENLNEIISSWNKHFPS
ncbi:MAG: DUF4160 domain-containing protein [Flavobacteriaceae bacterium]